MNKPPQFKISSIQERKKFYTEEFSIKKVKKWFGKNIPQLCAIDAGSESKVLKNPQWNGKMFYFPFNQLESKIKKFLPEDVYYDRNTYKDPSRRFKNLQHYNFLIDKNVLGQELVFDIDADNILCTHPKLQKVCNICLKRAYQQAIKLKNLLEKRFNFKKLKLVYSGRGLHIHVLDKSAFILSKPERKKIISSLKNFPIDTWVSSGNIELARMPFTLNSLVSRICLPLSKNNKFHQERAIPKFLKN